MYESRGTKLLVPGLLLGLLAATPALANTHQEEISLSWLYSDSDSFEANVYQMNTRFYFTPVDDKDKPLAEAAFLDRVGSVTLGLNKIDDEIKSTDSGVRGTGLLAQFSYARPNLPIVVQAAYSFAAYDYDPPLSSWEFSSNTYDISAGYYLTDSLLASISYGQFDGEGRANGSEFDDSTKNYGINAKYVRLLGNATALNLETGYTYQEDDSIADTTENNWAIDLAGDYYFTNLISLGAGVSFQRGDTKPDEGEVYLIRNKTYFNKNLGVECEYRRFNAKNDSGDDQDMIGISMVSLF